LSRSLADLLSERFHEQDEELQPAADDEFQIGGEVATFKAKLADLD